MYIPPSYQQVDFDQALQFVTEYPFGILTTNGEDFPTVTHLPFLIEKEGEDYYLYSHMAKANPQWKALIDQQVLTVFVEPHAYISPQYYTRESVPTWNYVAVHLAGKATLIENTDGMLQLMEKSIRFFDEKQLEQWHKMPNSYVQKLLKGIVAFRIQITSWQAKEKLSQDRNAVEQQNIVAGLQDSTDSMAQQLGTIMKKKYNSKI